MTSGGGELSIVTRHFVTRSSHVIYLIRQLEERRMAVDLILTGIEHFRLGVRIGGDDVLGAHHPDAHAFLPAREYVARGLQRHARIRCMHTATVLVIETVAAADKDFP